MKIIIEKNMRMLMMTDNENKNNERKTKKMNKREGKCKEEINITSNHSE